MQPTACLIFPVSPMCPFEIDSWYVENIHHDVCVLMICELIVWVTGH